MIHKQSHYHQHYKHLEECSKLLQEGVYSSEVRIQRDVCRQIDELHMRLQGLPIRDEGLHLEMLSLYMKLFTQISLNEFDCPTKDVVSCLERVYVSSRHKIGFHEENDDLHFLQLVEKLTDSEEYLKHVQGICQLILMQCLHWFITGHMTYAIRALTRTLPMLIKCQEKETNQHLNATQADSLKDSMQMTLAFAYYSSFSSHECLAILENIKAPHLEAYRKYLQACVLYKQSEYDKVFPSLLPLSEDRTISKNLSAKVLNLIGVCLAKQNKLHTAIQTFQKALNEDISNVTSLYNIATQYHRLHSWEAELDALNLCINFLRRKDEALQSIKLQIQENNCASLNLKNLNQISLLSVLYQLGKRYLFMKRYDKSRECFTDILYSVMHGGLHHEDQQNEYSSIVLSDVFHLLAFTLLQCGNYDDTLIVCRQAIDRYTPDSGQNHRTFHPMTAYSSESRTSADTQDCHADNRSRKRLRSLNTSQSTDRKGTGYKEDILSQLYQADALAHQNKTKEAVASLDRVIQYLNRKAVEEISESTSPCQPAKRQRCTAEGATEEAMSGLSQSSELLSLAYSNKAVICISQNQKQLAMHCLRLSLQHDQGNIEALYNQCLLLLKCGNVQDAAKLWFSKRDIDYHGDSLYLNTQLRDRKAKRRSQKDNSNALNQGGLEDIFLTLDIVCIQKWVNLKSYFRH